jgi:hypothetical protein
MQHVSVSELRRARLKTLVNNGIFDRRAHKAGASPEIRLALRQIRSRSCVAHPGSKRISTCDGAIKVRLEILGRVSFTVLFGYVRDSKLQEMHTFASGAMLYAARGTRTSGVPLHQHSGSALSSTLGESIINC